MNTELYSVSILSKLKKGEMSICKCGKAFGSAGVVCRNCKRKNCEKCGRIHGKPEKICGVCLRLRNKR